MKFKNPANGHIEESSLPGLWTLIFGGFYFIAKGLVAPLVIWFLLAVVLYGSMGAPATILMLVINLVFAAMAGSMVRSSYLRKGWVEVTSDSEGLFSTPDYAAQASAKNSPKAPHDLRKCPFCAEEIRAEAIKCKHCGSEVTPLEVHQDNESAADGAALMDKLGITYTDGKYNFQQYQYAKLEDAIAYAQLQAGGK